MIKVKQQIEEQELRIIPRSVNIASIVLSNEVANTSETITPNLITETFRYVSVAFEDVNSFLVEDSDYIVKAFDDLGNEVFYDKCYCVVSEKNPIQDDLYNEYETEITYKEYKG